MHILHTEEEPGVSTMTVAFAEDDHMFEVSADGDTAHVAYQETRTWRGVIRQAEPDESVYKELMTSDEMTAFLDRYGCTRVKRAPPIP